MNMCKRGCGCIGTYKLKDGSYTCTKNPSGCQIIKDKKLKTFRGNYGVDNIFQLPTTKEKIKQTNLKKYGVENPSQSLEIEQKKRNTCLKNYGVEKPAQSKIVQDRMKNTNKKLYDVEYAIQNKYIREKANKTIKEKYGVDNISQHPSIKLKKIETSLKNYSVEHPLKHPTIQKQIKQTNLKKYGVTCTFSLKNSIQNNRKSILKKYGVERPMQSKKFRDKAHKTKVEKGIIIPLSKKPLYEQYCLQVEKFTKTSWLLYYDLINPNRLPRSYREYHLDHIFSKYDGFKNNVPPYIIGHWTNLQMLSLSDNVTKHRKSEKSLQQLFEDFENSSKTS